MSTLAAGHRFHLSALAVSALLLFAFGAEAAAQDESDARCRRLTLDHTIGNLTAASWFDGGSELLVVDRLAGKLMRFDLQGRLTSEILRPGEGPSAIEQPLHVQAAGEGLLVQDDLYRLVWLDGSLQPTRSADSRGRVALLDHVVVGDSLFAYASVPSQKEMPFGFFELAASSLELLRVVKLATRPALDMFSLSRPVVARVGDAAFALDYGPPPRLRRLSEPGIELTAFPARYDVLPSFPEERGPEAIEVFSGVVERSRVPAQLHGFGRHLYLLTRYPSPGAGTVWELHRIDPARDSIEASFRLPTSSPDLEIVAGEPDWAIFEKGRIRIGGRQEVLGVLLLSASSLDGSEPSPWSDENPPDCR